MLGLGTVLLCYLCMLCPDVSSACWQFSLSVGSKCLAKTMTLWEVCFWAVLWHCVLEVISNNALWNKVSKSVQPVYTVSSWQKDRPFSWQHCEVALGTTESFDLTPVLYYCHWPLNSRVSNHCLFRLPSYLEVTLCGWDWQDVKLQLLTYSDNSRGEMSVV